MALPTKNQITGIVEYIAELNLDQLQTIRDIQVNSLICGGIRDIDLSNKQKVLDAVYLSWIAFVSKSIRNEIKGVTEKQVKEFSVLVDNIHLITKNWFMANALSRGDTKVIVSDRILDAEFGEGATIFHLSRDGRLENSDPMLASSYILVYDYQNIINTLAKFNL